MLVLLAFSGVRPAHGVLANAITVNSTADDNTVNGNCTLREAIIAANTNATVDQCVNSPGGGLGDVIQFDLASGDPDHPNGAPQIKIGDTPLPDITERVHIEGKEGNSNGPTQVEIHGPGGPPVSGHNGLTIDRDAAGTEIDDMVVNNFADDGILIRADEVILKHNYIGTDPVGVIAEGNQGFGVQVQGNGDRIGAADSGDCPYACSLIAGNAKANILLDTTASGARVFGNYIGTDATGAGVMLPANVDGVIDKGASDRIGGPVGTMPGNGCAGDCNIIIGVPEAVLVEAAASNSIIQGNFIGVDGAGSYALNNSGLTWGIVSHADGTMIGGTAPGARNLISGATQANVRVYGHSAVVEGNYIGTDLNGTKVIASSYIGVELYQAVGAVIGGTVPGAGNLISGASLYGVDIYLSTGVQVQGNLIGTAADGVSPLPNNLGVLVEQGSSSSVIGGTADGAGNIIAFSSLAGVRLDGSAPVVHNNSIRRNSIYSNDSGIDLRNGANDGILPPAIAGVHPLTGTSCANCTVEIFSDAGNEGKKFEGVALANGSGAWTFNGPVSGPNVTATATDASNNTSQFSAPFVLPSRATSTATAWSTTRISTTC